jgi:Phosphotransferase enzyme family
MEYVLDQEFSPRASRQVRLTPDEIALVENALPGGSRVERAEYFDNYDQPCPIRIEASLKTGETTTLVVRSARHGNVEIEAKVLAAAARFGLRVPRVLAGPVVLQDGRAAIAITFICGVNLQKLGMRLPDGLALSRWMLVEGIRWLSSVTDRMRADPIAALLPVRTLRDQLMAILAQDNPWLQDGMIAQVCEIIGNRLADVELPLVFSNWDYQPGNFLAYGKQICGILDFESAEFVDPLMGVAKFRIYDIHPLNKGGFVEEFLQANAVDTVGTRRIKLSSRLWE